MIEVIDSHTAGEPTRLVIAGAPDLGQGSMAERRDIFQKEHKDFRSTVINEPRGNDVIVGALLCEPVNPEHAAGVIFFNNVDCLWMCGHGTIGLLVTLAYMGRIAPGVHTIETPVGNVTATLHDNHTVSFKNVPSYRYKKDVPVEVPGLGLIHGDIAWGGNWFFLVNDHGLDLTLAHVDELVDKSRAVRMALQEQGITGADEGYIDHIEFFADPDDGVSNSKNFVLCPGNAYDRSPCGTGTSAKLSCLAADGKLATGEKWKQASILNSVFEGSWETCPDDAQKIIPTIKGQAFITGETRLIMQDEDPFKEGIV